MGLNLISNFVVVVMVWPCGWWCFSCWILVTTKQWWLFFFHFSTWILGGRWWVVLVFGGGSWFVLTFSRNKFLYARPNTENYSLAYFLESNKKIENIFLYVK